MQQQGNRAERRGGAAACARPQARLETTGSRWISGALLRDVRWLSAICLLLLACEDGASPGAGKTSNRLTSTDGSTGVPECDSYLDQYELCMQATLPQHQFNQHLNGIRRQRTAWKTLADSASKKEALAHVCRQAITTARGEFQACTWQGGL